ncbi:MAG: 6-phosphofructokinase [Clostridia bacterium]|nr:6-phosphofructokinase [Clostridia bacterium]
MKIGIITSGGDAPGMNAAVRATVRYALSKGIECLGYNRAYAGILDGESVPMNKRSVSNIIGKGGTVLYSDRCPDFLKKEVRLKAYEQLKKDGVDALIAIGGDGTFRGAADLYTDTSFPIVGLPATIDNDLSYTEFTIGFDTAVNNAIHIALHAGMSAGAEFILVPEIPFDFDSVCDEIEKMRAAGRKTVLIVNAEGAAPMEELGKQLKEKTGIAARETRLGFIQRGGSATYSDRMLASRMGIAAVDAVIAGKFPCVIGIKGGKLFDMNLFDALKVTADVDHDLYEKAKALV